MAETTDADNDAAVQTLLQRAWFRLEGVIERLQEAVRKMNTPESGTQVAREAVQGTDNSVRGSDNAHVNNVKIDIGDRTWSVIAAMLGCLAIGLAILAIVLAQLSERETKLAREDIRVMSIALAHHGINTDEHAVEKGDEP